MLKPRRHPVDEEALKRRRNRHPDTATLVMALDSQKIKGHVAHLEQICSKVPKHTTRDPSHHGMGSGNKRKQLTQSNLNVSGDIPSSQRSLLTTTRLSANTGKSHSSGRPRLQTSGIIRNLSGNGVFPFATVNSLSSPSPPGGNSGNGGGEGIAAGNQIHPSSFLSLSVDSANVQTNGNFATPRSNTSLYTWDTAAATSASSSPAYSAKSDSQENNHGT